MEATCTNCGAMFTTNVEHQLYRFRKTGNIFCKKKCGMEHRDSRRPIREKRQVQRQCVNCNKPFLASGWKITYPTPSCGPQCAKQHKSKVSSATMGMTNRVHAAERMRTNNPMHNAAVREKVARTLKATGCQPKIRGGNGCGPTHCEQLLLDALSVHGYIWQFVVKTGKHPGCPNHYKIDLAHPTMKIAVEVDGASHGSKLRQKQDAKKTAFLVGCGWKVFRFKNQHVLTELSSITSKLMACTLTLPTGLSPIIATTP